MHYKLGSIIGGYTLNRLIATGTACDVYLCSDPDGQKYAMKVEYSDQPVKLLKRESEILSALQDSDCFPKYYDHGIGPGCRYLVMGLLGPSLSSIRHTLTSQTFTNYTWLHLALEMLRCIKELHKRGFIHHDIKPANFLVRSTRKHPIVLADFGFTRAINSRRDSGFFGTPRYASLNAHAGRQLSKRDDLISWFYSIVEMKNGDLPWPGATDIKATARKKSISGKILCKGLPEQMLRIYNYIQHLKVDQEPDYALIEALIKLMMKESTFIDRSYDWEEDQRIQAFSTIPLQMDVEVSKEPSVYDDVTVPYEATSQSGCLVF